MADELLASMTEAAPATSEMLTYVEVDGVQKKVTHAAPGGMLAKLYQRTVTLTDAQIKALPTTPMELVPASGIGKIIHPVGVSVLIDVTAGSYTNIDATSVFIVSYDSGSGFSLYGATTHWLEAYYVSGMLADNSEPWFSMMGRAGWHDATGDVWPYLAYLGITNCANKNLALKASNGALGDYTGGNAANTLKVTVLYSIINV